MSNNHDLLLIFPGMSPEEAAYLQRTVAGLDDGQRSAFYQVYGSRRKNAQDIMLLALLGLVGAAGVHRFVLNQVGMGLLYFFTGGLCVIGTIVDLINHKTLTDDYNRKMVDESYLIVTLNR